MKRTVFSFFHLLHTGQKEVFPICVSVLWFSVLGSEWMHNWRVTQWSKVSARLKFYYDQTGSTVRSSLSHLLTESLWRGSKNSVHLQYYPVTPPTSYFCVCCVCVCVCVVLLHNNNETESYVLLNHCASQHFYTFYHVINHVSKIKPKTTRLL